ERTTRRSPMCRHVPSGLFGRNCARWLVIVFARGSRRRPSAGNATVSALICRTLAIRSLARVGVRGLRLQGGNEARLGRERRGRAGNHDDNYNSVGVSIGVRPPWYAARRRTPSRPRARTPGTPVLWPDRRRRRW